MAELVEKNFIILKSPADFEISVDIHFEITFQNAEKLSLGIPSEILTDQKLLRESNLFISLDGVSNKNLVNFRQDRVLTQKTK